MYVPGAWIIIPLRRGANQPLLEYLGPAMILSIFIAGANCIEEQADALSVLGIAMLTLIELYRHLRDSIPPTSQITFIEKILLVYIAYCLVVPADIFLCGARLAGLPSLVVVGTVNAIILGIVIYKYVAHYASEGLPPKQE